MSDPWRWGRHARSVHEIPLGRVPQSPRQDAEPVVRWVRIKHAGLSLPLKVTIALGVFAAALAGLVLQSYQAGH